jgi:signal transduction histidine kinase
MGRTIHDSGKRLERSIENFLIYSQLELLRGDQQKISALRHKRTEAPSAVIERHAKTQADAARRSSELTLSLANSPVAISEEYLAKIVDELVQNAFKFSSAGTHVNVAMAETPSSVMLSVADRGRGFSTDQITKVGAYMQFDRKMQEQQGLGLGLIIAKRLTELHGGTLAIQSEPGRATTITVKLPKALAG